MNEVVNINELNERIERESIDEVLRLCNGNITLAAEMLGITRTSLYRRIEKYKL